MSALLPSILQRLKKVSDDDVRPEHAEELNKVVEAARRFANRWDLEQAGKLQLRLRKVLNSREVVTRLRFRFDLTGPAKSSVYAGDLLAEPGSDEEVVADAAPSEAGCRRERGNGDKQGTAGQGTLFPHAAAPSGENSQSPNLCELSGLSGCVWRDVRGGGGGRGPRSLHIRDCRDCTLIFDASQPFDACRVENVSRTVIRGLVVLSAALVECITDAWIEISAAQLRMNDASRVCILCTSTTPPIIEQSSRIVLLEEGSALGRGATDLQRAGNSSSECTKSISPNAEAGRVFFKFAVDFSWRKEERSPNWMCWEAAV